MRASIYDDAKEKSTGEVPTALDVFNRSVTRLIQEVELSPGTICDLGSLKVSVTQEVLGLRGKGVAW